MDFPFVGIGPVLHGLTLIMLLVFSLAALGLVVYLAALPGRIAAARNHPQASAVSICGWLGLPTGVLWVLALAWAHWRYRGQMADGATNALEIQSLVQQLDRLEASLDQLEKSLPGAST